MNTNSSSKIARPSSIGFPNTPLPTKTITNKRRIASPIEHDNKLSLMKKKPQQIKAHFTKSHSMHKLDQYLLGNDERQESVTKQMHQQALLGRATTTPSMPRPSSLIKRFSEHTTGVLTTAKQSSNNTMKRSQSLANPVINEEIKSGGDGLDFRLGQRVRIPSLNMAGTVRFFGETKFKKDASHWVGIELDVKGTGKNDGSIQGVRYFTCSPNTGLFVLASKAIPILEQNDSSTHFNIHTSISSRQKITPRASKTNATTKKSQSSTTTTTTTTTTTKKKSMTITTNPSTAQPKRNRSATTNTVLKPSKSARIVSTRSNNQPLPTRSSPSAATKKTSTSTKTNQRLQTSKPALKKSSSLSTASNNHRCDHHIIQQPQPRRLLRCNSSGKTKMQEVTELQTLLEKSRQEQRALSQQMDGQEAAWDRLVSAKESYAVLVQEKDNEIARLKRFIDQTNQATDQLAKLANEKDAAQTRASMSEAMEKQHSKIIERLDARVQSLQQEALQIAQRHEAEALDRNAQMEQLREQLAERDEAAAIIERECGELRKTHIETVRAFESSITALKVDHAQMIQNKDAQIARLQQMLQDVHQIYPTVQEEENDMSPRRRLEAQLELSTRELDREREMIKSLQVEVEQLKEEIKRLHHVSVNSNSQFYALRNELDNEIQDKRRIMEEANAALEIQARTEEENERIKLTNDKTQRDLADVLKKLATMEKQQRGPDEVHYLMNKNRELEAQNEKLQAAQRQSEHECMRLMDELLAIEKVGSESNTNVAGDKIYRREIEQLKLQVVRETKRYNDLLDSKDAKCERLTKELADLESLVENKVFNETELEEAVENEKRKVRALELKLREEEEKNMHLISKQQQQYAPMSPTSPQYSLFHRQQHQSKVSSTGSFSLMTSSSLDTVSDHGNMLESVYCEICEVYGHEVMTCNAFMTEKDNISSSSYYCVNCDVFDIHPTEDCPNQDETF